jgi:hypothetical protein
MAIPHAGYAVGWFTLALLNAGLAQSKNRSGFAWWLVSLFIGPLATLVLVLIDPVPKQPVRAFFEWPFHFFSRDDSERTNSGSVIE